MSEKQNQQSQGPGGLGPGKVSGAKYNRNPFSWLIIGLIVFMVLLMLGRMQSSQKITFSQFRGYVEQGAVREIKVHATHVTGKLTLSAEMLEREEMSEEFQMSYNPEMVPREYFVGLTDQGVDVDFAEQDIWGPLLWNLLPILVLVGIIYFFFLRGMRAGGGGGMLMSFGRSRHKIRGKESTKITFKDVAGIEEAKEEVAETIEFLKNPKKFKKIGGRIPRGVLLVGPPGCGKTLLAKAIAGESDVPFFSISGSDFVEMFVGVGASRVRDLFKQAKENSPCIIFLDEIDAIGRKRGPGVMSGGHDEREQTLNAILVEMDGFDTNDQVIVIAATNRGDILDNALTRPGRFDRQVVVPLPDLQGRVKILEVHSHKIQVGPGVDFERIARGTPMFSGAELEALINEAAISASMADKDHVEMEDLEEARDKVRWGRAKRSRVVDEEDKKITAYHEAGHALVQSLLNDADPLHKVSIIPRGPYGGATFALPEKDRVHYTRKYCMAQLQVCFGGRIAEELFCDDVTSGAMADIQQATSIAREMVISWGMGENVGPIRYGSDPAMQMFYPGSSPDYSEKTAETIDAEIRGLIDQAYGKARTLIDKHKEKLNNLAKALLKYETLDSVEVKTILDGGELKKPTVADLLEAERQKAAQGDPDQPSHGDGETSEVSQAGDEPADPEKSEGQ